MRSEPEASFSPQDSALRALLTALQARHYRFVTITPFSHARVVERGHGAEAGSLADVLGWSLPVREGVIEEPIFALLQAAGAMTWLGNGLWKSVYRVSSLCNDLYLHSAFPTESADSVFFGPDSYRFADLLGCELGRRAVAPGARVVDIGTGSGVGAVVCGRISPSATIFMTDINPQALRLARINAAAAEVSATICPGSNLAGIEGGLDLITANPPYIIDQDGRQYRDGGGSHGADVALDMTRAAVPRLAVGGRFILYTGSAIIDTIDPLRARLEQIAEVAGCSLHYREIDPDVFGEELSQAPYRDVDRIAVVAAIFERSGDGVEAPDR